jgi:integrase
MASVKRRGRGEGSIERLPSGKFRAELGAGKDPATGKRVKDRKTFDTKREAIAWRSARQAERSRGVAVNDGGMTVSAWLDTWLEGKRSTTEPATHRWYERRARLHLKPRIGTVVLGKLSAMDVGRMDAKLTDQGVSAGERQKACRTLRIALEDAVRLNLIPVNVAKRVKLPKVTRRAIRPLDESQSQAFLRAAQSDRLSALYDLLLDAGCRPGEAFALHWTELNLDAGTALIKQSLEDLGGRLRLKSPKTSRGRRTVRLSRRTVASLRSHRERMRGEGHDVSSGVVFCDTQGGYVRLSNLRRDSFLKVLKRAGVPAIRLYDLGHTCATLLLSRDVNVKVVSERLGHESVEITLKFYAHCMPCMQERAVDALDSLFGNCPTGVPRNGETGSNGEQQTKTG